MNEWEIGAGGVGAKCPYRDMYGRCTCGICRKCGYLVHMAIHMHVQGGNIGDAPFGHRFEPRTPQPDERAK